MNKTIKLEYSKYKQHLKELGLSDKEIEITLKKVYKK